MQREQSFFRRTVGMMQQEGPIEPLGKLDEIVAFKKKYKFNGQNDEERPILNRLALHSYQLIFIDNLDNQHALKAELPKDMKALQHQLDKYKIKA